MIDPALTTVMVNMLRRVSIGSSPGDANTDKSGSHRTGWSGRKVLPQTPRQADHIVTAFAVLSFCAIFLQKLGISVAGGSIGLDAFILLGVLLWLFLQRLADIDPLRLVLYLAFSCTAMIGLIVSAKVGSLPALTVVLVLYATMLVGVTVDRPLMLRCLNKFQVWMTVIAFIVIGQQILQYTVGNRYWPNLDRLIPHPLLLSGYAYLRPYAWNSPYITPNGVFFLEPSACSGFIALALASEIVWFKRIGKLALFAIALVANIAGTGPTIILLFSPFLLLHLDRRLMQWLLGLGVPLLVIAAILGAFSHFIDRSTEFQEDNSSAYARMVVPFTATVALAGDSEYMLSGNGAGSSPKGNDQVQWPANKLIYEYGLLTAILFHIFLIVAVLRNSTSRTIALILLIPHLVFGGGFVSHTNIMLLVMFGSLLRLPTALPVTEQQVRSVAKLSRRSRTAGSTIT